MLPFAVFPLVLCHLAEEESIVELLLALLDHLGELVCHCVADALEESGLLLAQNRHRVLRECDEDSLVAEALVAHVLEVGVALQLQESLEVVVVQGIQWPQRAEVNIHRLVSRRGARVTCRGRLGVLSVLRLVKSVFREVVESF